MTPMPVLSRPSALLVSMVGLLTVEGACAKPGFDAPGAQIRYDAVSGNSLSLPHFELTIDREGVVRLTCRRYCAASGDVTQRISQTETRAVFAALETSGFFNLPRTTPSAQISHSNRDLITYRDNRMIHEVVAAGRLQAVVHAIRQTIDVDGLLRPSVALYRRRLAEGWNINSVDESQLRAIDMAALACDIESVRFLLAHEGVATEQSLFAVTRCSDPALMDELLANRALDPESKEARKLLVWGAEGGHSGVVRVLLNRGFKVDAPDDQKRTPLDVAVGSDKWDVIDLLLSRGANPNATRADGRPILWTAARSYNNAGIVLLIKYGAKVNAQDATGRTALMYAAEVCHTWNVQALLEAGADPRLTDSEGRAAADFHLPPSDANADKCASSQAALAEWRPPVAIR